MCLNWWDCGLLASLRERPEVDAYGALGAAADAAVVVEPFHFAFDPKTRLKKKEIQLVKRLKISVDFR